MRKSMECFSSAVFFQWWLGLRSALSVEKHTNEPESNHNRCLPCWSAEHCQFYTPVPDLRATKGQTGAQCECMSWSYKGWCCCHLESQQKRNWNKPFPTFVSAVQGRFPYFAKYFCACNWAEVWILDISFITNFVRPTNSIGRTSRTVDMCWALIGRFVQCQVLLFTTSYKTWISRQKKEWMRWQLMLVASRGIVMQTHFCTCNC